MIKDNPDFIFIENKVDNACYCYLLNKSKIITIKTADYNTNSDYFSIEIVLYGDSVELMYKKKEDMIEDFNKFKDFL